VKSAISAHAIAELASGCAGVLDAEKICNVGAV